MFLPCDLREWVPEDHIVHFILDAVEQIPTAHFQVNDRGTGSEQYSPTMMLALLIYCYATGRFGSRTIEAATYSDVAVRYLCANLHPDHSSICEFRVVNKPAFRAAFVSVLQLAQQLRLTRVGAVSVDGTKVQANANKHAAVSYQRAGEMIEQLELEVKELLERVEQAEAKEVQETLDIPAELARREKRVAALKQARQVIEQRAKEMAAAQQEEYEAKQAKRQAQREAGQKPRGAEPTAPSEVPDPKAQYNFTDPESRIMKAGNGQHFEQSYNAQAAVDEHSHHKTVADLLPQLEPTAPGPEASAKEVMAYRLKTKTGKALYKLRKQTVEPVFGIIKEVMGFRRFLLRGRAKVELEWTLVCVSYNLKRMFTLKNLVGVG